MDTYTVRFQDWRANTYGEQTILAASFEQARAECERHPDREVVGIRREASGK